jgi:3-oxoacyl-[acyl-carrier-protein] synthase II
MRMIQRDESDVMIAGGSEAIVELMHAGFCKLKTMSERNGEPQSAMRPFDRSRDGFLLGEGAAFLVVEELMHALARGAKIYAEVAGHGRSCEAYHATDPHPDGRGYRGAITRAMRDAGLSASDVDYVNAHGSATPLNDPIETEAIKGVFGSESKRVSVSATKPITGHLMGAAGAIESAICVLALDRQQIPPTINLRHRDARCDLDYVPDHARDYPVRAALNVNAGFGGRYACLALKKFLP